MHQMQGNTAARGAKCVRGVQFPPPVKPTMAHARSGETTEISLVS